jgi:purine-binding chemotaxis protein CheW
MPEKSSTKAEKQMVLFELGSETYGLDIATVHEIIRMQPITRVPKTPSYVEGVINLRGKVIPVIDMRKKFGLDKTGISKNNRIVVVNIQDRILGIIVDEVTEVLRIPKDSIEPVSDIINTANSDYLSGIAQLADKMVILLTLDKMLSGESTPMNIPAAKNGRNPALAGVKKAS